MASRSGTVAPRPGDVTAAVKRVRAALGERGVLMYHDARLPSFTALAAGEVVRGSWWAHPKNALIYAALTELGDDIAWPKLVSGKVTLVARSLWPVLVAAANSGDAWQRRGLSVAARELFERIDRPVAPAALGMPAGRGTRALVTELERRLLIYAEERHTDAGHHERVLTPWPAWCRARGLSMHDLPAASDAYATLEAAVLGWPGARLPWN